MYVCVFFTELLPQNAALKNFQNRRRMEDLVGRGMAVAGGSVMDEMNALFAPPGREAKTAAGQKQKTVELHPYFKRPGIPPICTLICIASVVSICTSLLALLTYCLRQDNSLPLIEYV